MYLTLILQLQLLQSTVGKIGGGAAKIKIEVDASSHNDLSRRIL